MNIKNGMRILAIAALGSGIASTGILRNVVAGDCEQCVTMMDGCEGCLLDQYFGVMQCNEPNCCSTYDPNCDEECTGEGLCISA